MSMPGFAVDHFAKNKIPTSQGPVECQTKEQFGDFTFVIGGKDYTLTPKEWMNDPEVVNLAQGVTRQ